MNNEEIEISSTDVIKAADTIEETIAVRNNHLVNNVTQDKENSTVVVPRSTTIDIDEAKWQKDYAAKMERNLERFKELGLYSQLQDLGIVYDPKQFQKRHVIANMPDGKQVSADGDIDSYAEVERQFDEQIENELAKKDDSKEDKKN
jgi:hypothetical protein